MAKRSSLFQAQVSRTGAGSIRITVRPRSPRDRTRHDRDLAVCVYKLAAEMERRSAELDTGWVVSPEVFNGRIDLELMEGEGSQAASKFVAKVIDDFGLG